MNRSPNGAQDYVYLVRVLAADEAAGVIAALDALEAQDGCVPLDKVTSFSNRTVSARDYGLVRVAASDGTTGIGFCYVGSAGGELLPIAVEKLLAPVLLGRDSFEVEALWTRMYQEALLQGR